MARTKKPIEKLTVKVSRSTFDNLAEEDLNKIKRQYLKQGYDVEFVPKSKDRFVEKIERRVNKLTSSQEEKEAMLSMLKEKGLELDKEKNYTKKQKEAIEKEIPIFSKRNAKENKITFTKDKLGLYKKTFSKGTLTDLLLEDLYEDEAKKELAKVTKKIFKLSASEMKNLTSKGFNTPTQMMHDLGVALQKGDYDEAVNTRKNLNILIRMFNKDLRG